MNANLPPAAPPVANSVSAPPTRRRTWLWVCGLLLGLLVVIVATVAITIWYIQRPIKPVVLSAAEKAAVEEKLQRVGAAPTDGARPLLPQGGLNLAPTEPDRPYEPGSKVLRLTERELNGMLNANTDLGQTVRLEFGRNAINAYVAAPIPPDVPLVGGMMFRARGRFRVSLTEGETPYAILEDVTVFGLSLPKAWMGGLKGENLLADMLGQRSDGPVLQGIKSLRVEPGALVLEVAD
ncbi:MAG: hypothetical protein KIS67_04265 [Verrucomicrobiae bacterium]|nr:hypothetical protein [Verrucomicrobiae bacterium]